eukprot:227296_1
MCTVSGRCTELNLNCLIYNSDGVSNRENNKYPHYPQTGEFVYDLRGLLVHCGAFRGRGGGHYIALVSDVQNNWYNIDNDDVTPINNIKRDVTKYFGGTNCVMMAMYIKRGCDNKYIFNSHTD